MLRVTVKRGYSAISPLTRSGARKVTFPKAVPLVKCKTPIRYYSSNPEPSTSSTSTSDNSPFFQYTWGSWLKNDQGEKSRRVTKFSVDGISKLIQDINVIRSATSSTSSASTIERPKQLNDGSYVLSHNLTEALVGPQGKKSAPTIKTIASIHEGKHHRVYKVTLANDKELVLRIPYKLESDHAVTQKIKSEVATLDFLDLKLGLNVPKVVAYGDSKLNSLGAPYILMEYIPGDLLMKQWDPLAADSDETDSNLKSVINTVADFQNKVLSVTFNKFGSLYFKKDVDALQANDVPYDGETDPALKDRWRIGPSVEQSFAKHKELLLVKQINDLNGPWDANKPSELIKAIASVELENLRTRLALADADSANTIEDVSLLNKQIQTFEHLQTISPYLLNDKSKSIMNVEELFKPRLFMPDLDPLNVINNEGKYYFIDFEYSSIKPFIFSSYPNFVTYNGAKVYDLEQDIVGYKEMDEVEQQQYQFMYYKTRNERLWELQLNSNRHDLIAIASPHIKALKGPYIQALELKNEKDYLYVEGSIIQLQSMWEAYVANELCNSTDTQFPISYTAEYLDQHQADLEQYQMEVVSSPFAATGGWIPQDMFTELKNNGIIVEDEAGNYTIETEKVLD
ncbi:altered inheritance of mitochondria protein 9, mitochondrial [Scheffersomyces amazonensis]|uniref:altered inheritance of mitochondria protein 9, mitochondrial n=1 Tax=Scheffersomyces amazonensis TaxID=1078765 RepID=UPI00315D8CD5